MVPFENFEKRIQKFKKIFFFFFFLRINLRNSIGGIVEKPSMNKIFNAGDYIIFRPKLLWEILNF
jgi:hypothetical protein